MEIYGSPCHNPFIKVKQQCKVRVHTFHILLTIIGTKYCNLRKHKRYAKS